MPSYRVRPGAIPKHLKITQQLPPASSGINSQYFVKGKPPIRASTVSPDTQLTNLSFSSAADAPQSAWFRLPRMRAEERSWFSRTTNARNAATAHPYSKLRDPLSIRIFDLIAMGSVPALLIYFLFYAPGGDNSDVVILRRWSAGIQQDLKNWWNEIPGDKEVDPQLLLTSRKDSESSKKGSEATNLNVAS